MRRRDLLAGAAATLALPRTLAAQPFPVLTAADLPAKAQDIVLFAPLLFMHTYLS